MVKKFLIHIRPRNIWKDSLRFSSTYGLGGILFLLYLILIITGVFLMLYYIPSINNAYISLKKIDNIIPFGKLMRNIHRLSGDLMIVFSFLHMLRIVVLKAFDNKIKRENWIIGSIIFFILFPFNFTGYLLPWDSVSYWGATIVLNIINHIPVIGNSLRVIISGSNNLDNITLIRFYGYHIFILPLIFTFFLMIHFYLVRTAGGVKVNVKDEKVKIQKLYEKEVILSLIVIIFLIFVCYKFYNAPLSESANSKNIPEIIKAPWYFASIQFLLTYFPALIAGVLVPIFFCLFIIFFYKIKNIYIFITVNFTFLIFSIIEGLKG